MKSARSFNSRLFQALSDEQAAEAMVFLKLGNEFKEELLKLRDAALAFNGTSGSAFRHSLMNLTRQFYNAAYRVLQFPTNFR